MGVGDGELGVGVGDDVVGTAFDVVAAAFVVGVSVAPPPQPATLAASSATTAAQRTIRFGRCTRRSVGIPERYGSPRVRTQWGMTRDQDEARPHDRTPIPVVLDVDTGVDDACALMFAARHPALDLRGVTCVGGNAPLPDVVRNTLAVLETAGRVDVPVGVGAQRPLLERPVNARHVHGEDGLGGLGLSPVEAAPDTRGAVTLLRDLVVAGAAEGAPVTLVPLAPMTNIALFARTHPEAFAAVGRIVFMGGGAMVSNATAAAEFNVFHDPEACAIVLDACAEHDVPVTMFGLDVFYEPQVTAEDAGRLRDLGTPMGRLAADLIDFINGRFNSSANTIGDAGAVALLVDPDAVHLERLPVRVELAGTWTRGRTVVDTRDWVGDMDHDPHGPALALVDVALRADGPRLARLWLDTIEAAK